MNTIEFIVGNRGFFPLEICAKGHHRIINILREGLND